MRFDRPTENADVPGDSLDRVLRDMRHVLERAERLSAQLVPRAPKEFPAGDPECRQCRGRGAYFSGAGIDVACPCVVPDSRSVVDGVVVEFPKADEA